MARCPYLEFDDHGPYWDSKFICKLSGKIMNTYDSQVKNTCKVDYGENYKNCAVYKRG